MPKKYDEESKARAVGLVSDHAEEYASRTACVVAVAKRLSVAPETLRRWINQIEVDARENHRSPQGGNEVLRAGERPVTPLICAFIAEHRARFGIAPICRPPACFWWPISHNVRLASGAFAYTAFVIDAYAGRIVGWTCSAGQGDAFVRRAIRHAVHLRSSEGNPLLGHSIHHSDAGSQGGPEGTIAATGERVAIALRNADTARDAFILEFRE